MEMYVPGASYKNYKRTTLPLPAPVIANVVKQSRSVYEWSSILNCFAIEARARGLDQPTKTVLKRVRLAGQCAISSW